MSTETQFNGHTLVEFDKLLIGEFDEIRRLQKEFESNGWCFIRLSDQHGKLANKLSQIQATVSAFFAKDEKQKLKYKTSTGIGYSRVGHKEGIKVLIDEHGLQAKHTTFPADVEDTLQYLSALIYNLTNVLKNMIYRMPAFTESSFKDQVKLSPLGMLDIVHYFNERTGPAKQPKIGLDTSEVNCVPHFDPGLFSLSILSTCDGLQLNDQLNDKWIDGPDNSKADEQLIAVVWLGEAASKMTNNRFIAGIHRVVYPRIVHQPRLTIWQEICTQAQIDSILGDSDSNIMLPGNSMVQLVNQPKSRTLKVSAGGESVSNLLKRVEYDRGLSMSKSGIRHIQRVDAEDEINQGRAKQIRRASNVEQNNFISNNVSNGDYLPPGTRVTMNNQPNSRPLTVSKRGESTNEFLKRMENERGLSMSKSGAEHMDILIPFQVKNDGDKPKKRSFLSKLFQ